MILLQLAYIDRYAVAAPRIERDVTYTTVSGEAIKLDVYRPENDLTSHPVVLLIHGGGWQGGDKKYHAYIGPPLAQNGYLAFSANYRLAPKYLYPAGVEDCQAALKWVRGHAANYGGDARRLALTGESAGGHLSSLLGLMDWTTSGTAQGAKDGTRVRSVINVFGPCDLTGVRQVPFTESLVEKWLGGPPEELPDLYRQVSPINLVGKSGPAFLHIHGTVDGLVPVEQSKRFDAKLKAASYDSTLLLLEGANHGWPPDSEFGKKSFKAILDFLERTLGRNSESG